MRFLLSILFIIAGTGLVIYYYAPEKYSCVRPIRYSIGELDERFGLSEEDLLRVLQRAEDVWEEAAGKDLFVYDENGRFKVNLIYDERQQKTDLVESTESDLNEKEMEYQIADRAYREKVDGLNAAVTEFNAEAREYEQQQRRYASQVSAWNRSARNDRQRLESLRAEEARLQMVAETLEEKNAQISQMRAEVNELLSKRNRLAESYNIDVAVFNQKFGSGESFDQGIYSRGQITIYQFRGEDDLALVLAHEFGHALGIDHVDDPSAVMYYLMEGQAKSPIQLSYADRAELELRCSF